MRQTRELPPGGGGQPWLPAGPLRRRTPRPLMGLVVLLGLLGLGAAAPARAVTISTNTTINSDILDNVDITGTAVVTMVAGGSVTGFLTARDSSKLTISGG